MLYCVVKLKYWILYWTSVAGCFWISKFSTNSKLRDWYKWMKTIGISQKVLFYYWVDLELVLTLQNFTIRWLPHFQIDSSKNCCQFIFHPLVYILVFVWVVFHFVWLRIKTILEHSHSETDWRQLLWGIKIFCREMTLELTLSLSSEK